MSSAQKTKSSTSAKAAKSAAPKKAAQATTTAKSTTGKVMVAKKSVVLKLKTAKKAAFAPAAAAPGIFSGVRPRGKNPGASAILEAVNKITKRAKSLIEKSATATPKLPKKLTPFAGWTSNPSDDDIAKVQKARKLFSVDNS